MSSIGSSGGAGGGGAAHSQAIASGGSIGDAIDDVMPPGLSEDDQLAWILALSERTHAREAQARLKMQAPSPPASLPPKSIAKTKSAFGGIFGSGKK